MTAGSLSLLTAAPACKCPHKVTRQDKLAELAESSNGSQTQMGICIARLQSR